MCPRIVIAGERSGCGKTAVSLALMSAFSEKGLSVQGLKAGPDYIDPSHYEARTGAKGANIDLWMTPAECALELFCRRAARADISIIEGVMGLYDGAYPDNSASTADVAKLLAAPVILVLDASASAASVAATALGFKMFDPQVKIAGVILNRVRSQNHAAAAARSVAEKGFCVLGSLPENEAIKIPSRHLGLVHAAEQRARPQDLSAEAELASNFFDIARIEKIARGAPPLGFSASPRNSIFPPSSVRSSVRLAVARDRAFSFYYEDTLELLSLWGCEIAPFSPLSDEDLPEATDAVFICGGFPEIYSAELEGNFSMRKSLQDFARVGGTIYGECGGMMYLGRALTDLSGRKRAMCGVIDAEFEMRPTLQSLGYRRVSVRKDAAFFRLGDSAKGHEFHYSVLSGDCGTGFFEAEKSSGGRYFTGISARRTAASYLHLNLFSDGLVKKIPQRIKSGSGRKF